MNGVKLKLPFRCVKISLVGVVACVLASCQSTPEASFAPHDGVGAPRIMRVFDEEARQAHVLAEAPYNIDIIRFDDVRRPLAYQTDADEKLIYEYNPDKLFNGLKYRTENLMRSHLQFNGVKEDLVLVEVELRDFKAAIVNAGALSGRFGQYKLGIELDVLARLPDSSIVGREKVLVTYKEPRTSADGRQPDLAFDKQKMLNMFDAVVKEAAIKTGWLVINNYRATKQKSDRQAKERAKLEESLNTIK